MDKLIFSGIEKRLNECNFELTELARGPGTTERYGEEVSTVAEEWQEQKKQAIHQRKRE